MSNANQTTQPKLAFNGEWIIYISTITAILFFVRAWDAMEASFAPSVPEAFIRYFQEPSGSRRHGMRLFLILTAAGFLVWLFRAAAWNRKHVPGGKSAPMPILALIQSVLPPFVFYRPYSLIKELLRETESGDELALSVWWGGIWTSLILFVGRNLFLVSDGIPTGLSFFHITLGMLLIMAFSLCCLAYVAHRVNKKLNSLDATVKAD